MSHDSRVVLPTDSALLAQFETWAQSAKRVFFAGLPGVGKSLYLQQLALLAQAQGRRVHLLLWDRTRLAFERLPYTDRYPESADGATHPAIRKAVGEWARQGLTAWAEAHADSADLLIGEVPLVGNRLIELVQQVDDSAETHLTAPTTIFSIPVPSARVRAHIEQARHATIAAPRNEREKYDASPPVMYETWYDMHAAAYKLGIAVEDSAEPAYSADIYTKTYQHLLQHRNTVTLDIDTLLKPTGSVYDLDNIVGEVHATDSEVAAIIAEIDTRDSAEIEQSVKNWYKL